MFIFFWEIYFFEEGMSWSSEYIIFARFVNIYLPFYLPTQFLNQSLLVKCDASDLDVVSEVRLILQSPAWHLFDLGGRNFDTTC